MKFNDIKIIPLEPSTETIVNLIKDRLNYFIAMELEEDEEYDALLKCYKILSRLI